jgi:PAS domain S-box-containing protein
MSAKDSALDLDTVIPARRVEEVSASLLHQVVDRAPAVTLVAAGPELRIIYANRAAEQAARTKPGTLAGLKAADAFEFVDPILAVKWPEAEPRIVSHTQGTATVWWEVSYVALDNVTPETPAVLITAVDVTQYEITRATVQMAQATEVVQLAQGAPVAQDTLDALLTYVPGGISIAHGPEVHVERISASGMAMVGRNAAELTGKSALQQTAEWEVYRPGSDVPLLPADRPMARATRTGQVTMDEMLLVRRPDGSLLPVLCNSGPIRDAAGRVTGAVMAWHDVSELQRAQAELRDSGDRLRAVLLQIPAAIFIVEAPDGRMTFKSQLLDEVLGHPDTDLAKAKATLRGWAVHKDGSPYDLSEYPSRRALFNGETVRAEPMGFWRGDGRLIDLEMHAGPVRNEAGEIVAAVAVALDVTERRLAEARQAVLFCIQDALRSLTEPREILTAAATHLGRHLGAARIGYSEVQPDNDTVMISNGYVDGALPVNGIFPLDKFGAHHAALMRQGKTLVYEDVQADERGARPFGLELGTRGHVSVPLVRDGRYVGSLYVTHLKPHKWTPEEVALIEEVAARIWEAAERGRAESRLHDSEQRLRLVLESTGLGSWEYDAVTGKTIGSERHDEIFGYPAPISDWSFERFISHIAAADRASVEAGFHAALHQGRDWDVECRMIKADGSEGWLKVCAKPHLGPDGKITRLLGTVADISARVKADNDFVETAAKFETFARTMPSMVWTSLPDGRIDWFNAQVPEYCGISEAEMKPDGWAPVHPDDLPTAGRAWQEALASGQPYVTEYRIRRYDGMFRWHITRAKPIRGADGAIMYWIGTSADIHDQKNAEQALADLNATLERQVRDRTAELMAAEASLRQSQKMEAVGQLTGGLAHDFNNLLTAISGSLELLDRRLAQGRISDLDRYLRTAQGAAKRAAALTHRLLAFSRRQTLDPKPTDMNGLIFDIDELIRRTTGPAITVTVSSAPELWSVLVDPNQLENALLNLCINARDAMPDGGGLMIETANETLNAVDARTLEIDAGGYVSLSVTDTGVGMTPDVIARAFDPFFTTKPLGEGTGLGLSMVYGFARQSGGQARIASELGNGTRVTLYLPRYLGEQYLVQEPVDAQTVQPGGGETVLVVDDEAAVRVLVKEVLDELGYQILEAEDGNSGLEILRSVRRVDLLVTDVGLPGGLNGRQLADAALMVRPDLNVLFITGYAENAVIGEGHMKPGMHVMIKPFSLEILGRRIREIISGI